MGYICHISHANMKFILRQTMQGSQTQQDTQDEFYLQGSEAISVSTIISDMKSEATACSISTYMFNNIQPCDSSHCPWWWRQSQYLKCWTWISASSGQSSKISLPPTALKSSNNKHKLSMGINTHDDIIINKKFYYSTSLF